MGAVVAWLLLVAFIGVQVAAITAAAVARDGWHGWRRFWL